MALLVNGPAGCPPACAQGFLRAHGHDIVDETGKKVLLRGVGLGNWLLPEGYMWKFGREGDRPRKIEKLVEEMVGTEEAERFWRSFRKQYITEADIARIAELGYNSVRPALNARRFMTEEEHPVFVDEGFALLDQLLAWCKKHNLYVILDMHGAPGGQTGQNIDDSPNDLPELFMDKAYQDRLLKLWLEMARRYKDEPTVAGYDLLNEPLPGRTGALERHRDQLEPLYKRLTTAIREIDPKHMIILEGGDWSNDWSVFSQPFDDNLVYQFHYYCWDRPDKLKDISDFVARREAFNVPVWVGETGEKGNTIYWATTQLFEANNIGWSFWPWKKMDTANTPYSINTPEEWDAVREFSRGGAKPDRALCRRALGELLENIKLEHCVFFPDVVNAMFRRIPGKVEAENYGHDGEGDSYQVADTNHRAETYRTGEPVPIVLTDFQENQFLSGQSILLGPGEWVAFPVTSPADRMYAANTRLRARTVPATFTVEVNGEAQTMEVAREDWHELSLGPALFKDGLNRVKVSVTRGAVLFDWFSFK